MNFRYLTSCSTPLVASVAAWLSLAPATHAESLWTKETNNERGMFADKRAKGVGDIVTIVVKESITATQGQELKTFKDSKPSATGQLLTGLLNQFVAGIPAAVGLASIPKIPTLPRQAQPAQLPQPQLPSLETSGKDEYRGGGEITNRQTVSSRAAVTVMDVLPNGNLVIEGTKVIRNGKETQYAYLRGIIRAVDVQKDNTVLSTNIADVHIEFIPEGSLTDAQKKGWLLRLNDRVKPF